jgi:prepilin-type N-terminal cleavage/methylation domain-containing protein
MTSKHHGMSLVELLMGLLISSLIFLTLMQVYLSGKRQYQVMQKQLAIH